MRENLHLASVLLPPVHALQFAGSRASVASPLCGRPMLGIGGPHYPRSRPRGRSLYAPPLVSPPARGSAPHAVPAPHPGGAEPTAVSRGNGQPPRLAVYLARPSPFSASALAPAPLRNFRTPPSLPGNFRRFPVGSIPGAKRPCTRNWNNSNSVFLCWIT